MNLSGASASIRRGSPLAAIPISTPETIGGAALYSLDARCAHEVAMEGLSASPYMPVLWLGWYGARPDRNGVGMTVGLLDTLHHD